MADSTLVVRALEDVAVLRVTGDDARSWLNGQVTSDLRDLAEGQARYALVLTVRGKILADAWVLDRGRDVLLLVPATQRAAVRERLEKYVIMEDVELSDAPIEVLTVQGARAAEVAGARAAWPSDRLGLGGRDVLVDASERDAVLAELTARAEALGGRKLDAEGWRALACARGVPQFGQDFGEANYPQEAGLQERAVSFQKGCYLGQEVVCTLENRGQLTKRLVRLEVAVGVTRGTALSVEDKSVGEITSAFGSDALGYVKRAHAVEGASLRTADSVAVVRGLVG